MGEKVSVRAIAAMLAEAFDVSEVHWKAQAVSGNRCLAVPYVDARSVMDRLDDVLGVNGWHDAYDVLPSGEVLCRLSIRLGNEWVTKSDVGAQSEQPDEGDRLKAAVSDALKRAAVKFSIGRYLYRLPKIWCDYDPQRKQIVRPPLLPAQPEPQAAPQADAGEATTRPAPNGQIQDRGLAYEKTLVEQGLCRKGELLSWLDKQLGEEWAQCDPEDVEAAALEFQRRKKAAKKRAG